MSRYVVALLDRYGRIRSKFNTYDSEQAAERDVDRAGDLFASRGWHACWMTEYAYNQKLARENPCEEV